MTDPRRLLGRIAIAGGAMFVIAFLPWVRTENAWATWMNLWGPSVPSWLVVVVAIAAGVAAYLQQRGAAQLHWAVYFAVAVVGFLYTLVFMYLLLADGAFPQGPLLAFGAFAVMGIAAFQLRPPTTREDASDRGRQRRRDARQRRREKGGPEPEPGSSDRTIQDPEGEGSSG